MTNEEKLKYELETLHQYMLNKLADEALDRGEEKLSKGYRWLSDHDRWPFRDGTGRYRWWVPSEFLTDRKRKCSYSVPVIMKHEEHIQNYDGITYICPDLFGAIKEAALAMGEHLSNDQ